MFAGRRWLKCVGAAGLVLVLAGPAAARKEALLDVSKGQIPNDTGSDGQTKLSLENCPELGGPALKVVFAASDSCGDRQARIRNWKQFIAVEFEVFNPGREDVALTFTVRHRRTTSFQTRVDYSFKAKPGKTAVKIGIDELLNVNGSVPDLADVNRWYFADEGGKAPTLFFSSIWLVGEDLPASPAAPAGAGAGLPAAKYRVTGKVGDMPVDLTATPEGGPAAAAAPHGDPARVARIRAAKMPPITKPVMFNTPEADAILSRIGGLSAGQSLEPGRRRLAAASGLGRHHRLDRTPEAAAVQPGHGLRAGAARPAASERQDHRLSGRIGQGPVPGAGQPAHRGLAGLRTPATPG